MIAKRATNQSPLQCPKCTDAEITNFVNAKVKENMKFEEKFFLFTCQIGDGKKK